MAVLAAGIDLLTGADLSAFTNGRLPDDDATDQLVVAALAAARRYCGWCVTPVETVTVTVDGPGGRVLSLPTRNLLQVHAVTENGVDLDVETLFVSQVKGTVTKRCGMWTSRDGGISVDMEHGYEEAPDFDRAVLTLADAMSKTSQRDTDMVRKKVGEVEYQWSDRISTNSFVASLFSQFLILQEP